MRAAMSAQRNRTDAADALGLAHIVCTGWFKAELIKTCRVTACAFYCHSGAI